MLLGSILLFSAFLAPHVLASKKAGPYQVVYMWMAYRMDIQAFGARDEMIAPNCFGTVPDGTCYFDEFLEYIQKDGKTITSGLPTSIGKYFWPDAVSAAQEIEKLNGGGFVPDTDAHKLFQTGTFTVGNPQLSAILDMFTDKIQAARIKLGDDALSDGLEEARTAITGVHQARVADQGQDYIDVINDYLRDEKGTSLTVETKNPTALDGSTYLDVDIEKTVAKDSAFAGYWKDFQTWMSQQKRTKKTKVGNVKMHWDAIQGVQRIEARAWGDSSC
ncbi:hypothetical protein BDW67DRAFT_126070 [Aspergillus spinulosporus]